MLKKKKIRIGNASGYWGDDPNALKRQVMGGPLDYITMDFLAEITMSILQKQYEKNSSLGYARDFVTMLMESLPQILEKKIKIISNAGGINPLACAKEIERLSTQQGLKPKIALVMGDNILGQLDSFYPKTCSFENLETQESFDHIRSQIKSANVYFGAMPIVDALRKWDPDIIITGRSTDTGLTLAPMVYEFNWDRKDWNKLASGIVAGHLLECGCQVTGGNFSDWQSLDYYHDIGYPIAEVSADGSFVLTKHPKTGGLVSVDTVREQVFYEMGDPSSYITPDVIADFSTIHLEQEATDRVMVSGIKGCEPTSHYKVSMAYENGYKAIGSIIISGPNAKEKADRFADIFWKRCQTNFSETLTECVGWDACHRSLGLQNDCSEILLRLGVRSPKKESVTAFSRLVSSLILSGPPGVSVLGGVPKAQTIVNYWPALIDKKAVDPSIMHYQGGITCSQERSRATVIGQCVLPAQSRCQTATLATKTIEATLMEMTHSDGKPLSAICLARSGDKGDSVNIGLLARSQEGYQFIKQYFTAQRIKNLFQELCLGRVHCYPMDGLLGLNFILEKSLGGGGSCTLRVDSQGKTFSQALLRQKIKLPESLDREMSN